MAPKPSHGPGDRSVWRPGAVNTMSEHPETDAPQTLEPSTAPRLPIAPAPFVFCDLPPTVFFIADGIAHITLEACANAPGGVAEAQPTAQLRLTMGVVKGLLRVLAALDLMGAETKGGMN